MLSIQTVLHPTDFSECSDYAFRLACSLARDHGARVVALHVVTPPVVVYGEGVIPSSPEVYEDQGREQLRRLQPDPAVQLECRLVRGYAAEEVLRVAEETRCDLIVMGTHGRTGLSRLLMGSVAEQVLRKAPCPVLTVKAPPRQQPPSAREPAGQVAEAAK
jgi:nucleotide-binding universal stress UspA family protein